MGGKDRGLSLLKGVSHTYTLKLDYSIISILYKKKLKKKRQVNTLKPKGQVTK